jgi:hypothetical protein
MLKKTVLIDGYCAVIVGILSIVYAVLYLLVRGVSGSIGINGSWLVLAASGIFSSAVFVALYEQTKTISADIALWAVLIGVAASLATLAHGSYEFLLSRTTSGLVPAQNPGLALFQQFPSQVDPAGVFAFFITGLATLSFNILIAEDRRFPRALAMIGIVNSIVLIILFFATAAQIQALILVSGGLTSVILGPIWWIWLGQRLIKISNATT